MGRRTGCVVQAAEGRCCFHQRDPQEPGRENPAQGPSGAGCEESGCQAVGMLCREEAPRPSRQRRREPRWEDTYHRDLEDTDLLISHASLEVLLCGVKLEERDSGTCATGTAGPTTSSRDAGVHEFASTMAKDVFSSSQGN